MITIWIHKKIIVKEMNNKMKDHFTTTLIMNKKISQINAL